jgi:hypothetical protein
MTSREWSGLLIGRVSGVIASLYLLTDMDVCSGGEGVCGVIFLLAWTGMLLTAVTTGNPHYFKPWLVVLFNWILYPFIYLGFRKVIRKFREK